MSTSHFKSKIPKTLFKVLSQVLARLRHKQTLQMRSPTLILLGIVILSAIIAAAWFAGEHRISQIFEHANILQQNPPMWLEVPMVKEKYLLAPTIFLLLMVLGVMQISPQPRTWSRRIVVSILIILTLRYVVWRSLSTLNLINPLNGIFSIGLFVLEMIMLIGSIIQLFLMLNVKDRKREADINSLAVLENKFNPTVDIFIPTYDEPVFILRRTIIGCQALDYGNKQIYLLDDTRRLEMEKLALELGCKYLAREENSHAKAGNLNHAITKTNGELIVVFDADFIPTINFLTRTVGFFQDANVALVQTPQSFYNADPIARNLGLENILIPEEEVFYRQVQPVRDGVDSVVCAGTSFIIRRSALQETGGFVTESLSEDYFTGIKLSANGYRLIYLDEKLSAGLAAENISAHATQRLRWARGTLQGFFIKSNPLTIPGLNLIQRLAHLEGLLHWFTSISRVYFLIMPLAYSFLGVIPIRSTPAELIYYFLPYYLVNLIVFSWLNNQSRSAILSDIYSLILCFPLALTVIQVMLHPFSKGFQVTPKGMVSNRYTFNWNLGLPLIILFIATALSLWRNLGMSMILTTVPQDINLQIKGIGLGWLWSTYNLITIGIGLLVLIDAPKLDRYEWFDLRKVAKLKFSNAMNNINVRDIPGNEEIYNNIIWGVTSSISEAGAEIELTQIPKIYLTENMLVSLEVLEENLHINAEITQIKFNQEYPTVCINFQSIDLKQHRSLVKMLFCRPGQWKRNQTPGELQSILLLFKILLKPRIFFDKNIRISPNAILP
ncbi:MAG: glycosyltransferase [Calothrix sp. CSU_2_0]|nr:glycosyltransferase [Calothrix sp. CSU_2_0]